MDYNKTRHAVYRLTYHMIFVTKWRKPVISDEMGDFMKGLAARLCKGYGGELLSAETDRDHMHLLVSLPIDASIPNTVRSLKTQLSREVRQRYGDHIRQHLYGDAPFWSPSFFIATTGSVSMETVKAYIESQRTDDHRRKYVKRSSYWQDGRPGPVKKKESR